jgi:hypothetical protein
MKEHPLFCDEDSNDERRSRDIGYINIYRFQGSKRAALPNQWDPEQLQTIEDVYREVGAGQFELVGREGRTKQVVDRVMLHIESPRGETPPPAAQAAQQPAQQQPQQQPGPPQMNIGGMQIPSNMDPHVAMFVSVLHSNATQSAAQVQAAREDNKNFQSTLTQLMLGFTNSQTQMVTGLVSGLAGAFGHAPQQANQTDRITDAFLKGVELVGEIKSGMKEGSEAPKQATDLGAVVQNVAQSISAIRDIAAAANAAPMAPIVPPGGPA